MRAPERFTYSSAPERRDRIAYFVTEQGYCTITELSRLFSVSEMTIRRDVSRLVLEGRLRGFHGGVGSLTPGDMLGRDYSDRVHRQRFQKWNGRRVARSHLKARRREALR